MKSQGEKNRVSASVFIGVGIVCGLLPAWIAFDALPAVAAVPDVVSYKLLASFGIGLAAYAIAMSVILWIVQGKPQR